MNIEDKLIDALTRFNFIFKNQEIYTECVKNYEGFTVFGESFGPFEQGKKYKLKFFHAVPFIENNILKPSSSEKYDHFDVQRDAMAERDDEKLVEQKELFMNKLRQFKVFLQKEVDEGIKPRDVISRYDSYFSNIVDARLMKLLEMSKTQTTLSEEKKFTDSEQFLFKKVQELIQTWRTYLLSSNIKKK